MHRIALRFAPVLVALLMSFALIQFASAAVDPAPREYHAVLQQSHGDGEGDKATTQDEGTTTGSEVDSGTSIKSVVLWSASFLAGLLIVMTALYMLKRRVGGFPKNPDWVAPIEAMYSKDSPDEGAYGDTGDAHGAHGAAHGASH